jgi:aspartyl-tRNA(Asn)/glutamyl-tRNA(Gln) amidotransferase subunit B
MLAPDAQWVERVRAALPLLPAARRTNLAALTGADEDSEAIAVVVERGQDTYIEEVKNAGGDAGRALVWVQQSFAEEGNAPRLPAKDLAALTVLERDGKLTATQAKTVLGDMLETGGGDPAAIAASKGFEALDTSVIEGFVDEGIAAQPDAWAKYCAGEEKAMGALVGTIMKLSKGKADGKVVTAILQQRRGS